VERKLTVLVLDVDAVQAENMEVHVEPGRSVRTLHHDDEPRQCLVDARKAELSLGALLQRAAELFGECARRHATQLLVVAEHRPYSPGEGAHPVTHRHLGQHLLLLAVPGPFSSVPHAVLRLRA
jgi:hypothetical protein